MLFAVSLVQESVAMSGSMVNQDAYITEARQIRDLVSKLNGFHLDHTEYTCLKALALFKPGKFTVKEYVCNASISAYFNIFLYSNRVYILRL